MTAAGFNSVKALINQADREIFPTSPVSNDHLWILPRHPTPYIDVNESPTDQIQPIPQENTQQRQDSIREK
jgi:hypothetical protein